MEISPFSSVVCVNDEKVKNWTHAFLRSAVGGWRETMEHPKRTRDETSTPAANSLIALASRSPMRAVATRRPRPRPTLLKPPLKMVPDNVDAQQSFRMMRASSQESLLSQRSFRSSVEFVRHMYSMNRPSKSTSSDSRLFVHYTGISSKTTGTTSLRASSSLPNLPSLSAPAKDVASLQGRTAPQRASPKHIGFHHPCRASSPMFAGVWARADRTQSCSFAKPLRRILNPQALYPRCSRSLHSCVARRSFLLVQVYLLPPAHRDGGSPSSERTTRSPLKGKIAEFKSATEANAREDGMLYELADANQVCCCLLASHPLSKAMVMESSNRSASCASLIVISPLKRAIICRTCTSTLRSSRT